MAESDSAVAECAYLQAEIDELEAKLKPHLAWTINDAPLAQKHQYDEIKDDEKSKPQRCRKLSMRMNTTAMKVSAVDWHQDSRHLLTATCNGKLVVWDAFVESKDLLITPVPNFADP
jgi:hypothetical protein